ncbi:DgyrCDS13486 [Dimorphilus gyrociliatus]|uniref:protein-tyrosine-phosphatase n=1 Tax=Dimorphilus gyrociliatus TaxID=2664684 RepID=A0A7I8WAS7_9ANNE|nr:DgyrCDS13486 [Dimorphilus gyrociliatus]
MVTKADRCGYLPDRTEPFIRWGRDIAIFRDTKLLEFEKILHTTISFTFRYSLDSFIIYGQAVDPPDPRYLTHFGESTIEVFIDTGGVRERCGSSKLKDVLSFSKSLFGAGPQKKYYLFNITSKCDYNLWSQSAFERYMKSTKRHELVIDLRLGELDLPFQSIFCDLKIFGCGYTQYLDKKSGKCKMCNCDDCDISNGICTHDCHTGFKKNENGLCNIRCNKSYGKHCSKICKCLHGTCDVHGYCPDDQCEQYYYNIDCSIKYDNPKFCVKDDYFKVVTTGDTWTVFQWWGLCNIPEKLIENYLVFELYYRSVNEENWKRGYEIQIDGEQFNKSHTANITSLQRFTTYKIRLDIFLYDNLSKKILRSETQTFKTLKCYAPTLPKITNITDFETDELGGKDLTIEWKYNSSSHVNSHCNVKKIEFKIIKWNSGNASNIIRVVSVNRTSLEIYSLQKGLYIIEFSVLFGINKRTEFIRHPKVVEILADTGNSTLTTQVPYITAGENKISPGSVGSIGIVAILGSILLVVAILIFLFMILKRRRDLKKKRDVSLHYKVEHCDEQSKLAESFVDEADHSAQMEANEKPPLNFMEIEQLKDVINEKAKNDGEGFMKEYESIPRTFYFSSEIGRKMSNKHKNKFNNIIPYDQSRVILEAIPDVEDSDYINANWITGYGESISDEKPFSYIASQGANKFTTQDIWAMVWQVNAKVLVMLTNIIEGGKRKCELYWPEEDEKQYGNIKVKLESNISTVHYVIRTFKLTKDDKERTIKHFHYTTWPDHGVPTSAVPLIEFHRKVREYEPSKPLVIHCSAGVGRTGAFISLDYLLKQSDAENGVDVSELVWKMRQCRVHMVQTAEQYMFIYRAIYEAIQWKDSFIKCSEFAETYFKLQIKNAIGKTEIETEFEKLQAMNKDDSNNFTQGGLLENIEKNRLKNVLPADNYRPYLLLRMDGCNDYINAVIFDGVYTKNAYAITQMPLPNTDVDLWRMVVDHNFSTIVMLNDPRPDDESYGHYVPIEEKSWVRGPLEVSFNSQANIDPSLTIRDLTVKVTKEEKTKEMKIKHFQFYHWPTENNIISNQKFKDNILNLIKQINVWRSKIDKENKRPVVFQCHDGFKQSGLVLAVTILLEKIQVQKDVDVPYVVRELRLRRPELICDLDQYKFLYEIVKQYLEESEV